VDAAGSRTARMVARFRALATDLHPTLAPDPFAAALTDALAVRDAETYLGAHPHMVLYMALRTAAFDDEVRAAAQAGIAQVVNLGAGLDMRAMRLAATGARFFEVDHPATQADKRARLAAAGLASPAAFVPCDFENDDFLARLVASGFDPQAPALFVWEGVVYYLTEDAVRGTASRIARECHPRARLAFDLVGKRFVRGEIDTPEEQRARTLVAEMGEPLRFGSDDPLPLLFACGFRDVRTETFDAIALRLTGTYARDRKMRFQQIAVASVTPRARP
jgi:methyltransferase (TIGR00027 family)